MNGAIVCADPPKPVPYSQGRRESLAQMQRCLLLSTKAEDPMDWLSEKGCDTRGRLAQHFAGPYLRN
eukprot:scaffold220410_cov32-Tisochrysis_lutea.AAC.1